MGRLALSVSTLVMCIAVGGAFAAIERSYHGTANRGFSAFAINPRHPHIVYAGSGSGVFKSTDRGGSWQAVNEGLTELNVSDLVIDQRRPAVLYAATTSSVFKSTNAGRTWRQISSTEIDPVGLALHPSNSRVLYAATDEGVYKSSDAGVNWRKVTTHPHAVRVSTVVLDPQQPATVYAASGGGVFKSTDAGRSWEQRNRGLFPNETPDDHSLLEGNLSAIVVNSRRPPTLYVGYHEGVVKSTDGARTWRPVNTGLAGSFRPVGSLAIDPSNPQTLYAGTSASRGLFKTTDGGRRWSAIDRRFRGNVSALALDPTHSQTVYVGMSFAARAFKSTDGGRTWSALSIPVP